MCSRSHLVLPFLILVAILLSAAHLAAQIVGPDYSAEVEWVPEGITSASLYNLPDGSGRPFSQAFAPGGIPIDATIRLTLMDRFSPVADFPAEDLWLVSADGGLVNCRGGAIADADTDADGTTVWAAPLFAGGFSADECVVMISDYSVQPLFAFALHFNSADISGDGVVNLTDAGMFSLRLGSFDHAADYNYDGIVNVSDAGFMAGALGVFCP